jgi:hypothetical protein
MAITDGDVVQRLVHPDVFRKLRLSNPTVIGGDLRYLDEAGASVSVAPTVTFVDFIETKVFSFPTGRLIIQRDGLELLSEVFHQGADGERKVLRCALRDRLLDGTPASSPLCPFPNTHEATNRAPHPVFRAAELSIYCYDPERYLPANEMRDFIVRYDEYVYKHFEPEKFFRLWTRAFEASNMAPWQPSPSMKGVAQHFVDKAGELLTAHQYHRMDAVCGFYNVAMFFIDRMGFEFTYGEHKAAFQVLQGAVRQLESRIGRRLNLREQAWVVALQNIPAEFIPPQLALGVRWFNSPTDTSYVCRLHRDLNRFPPDPRVGGFELPSLFSPAASSSAATVSQPDTADSGSIIPPPPDNPPVTGAK